MTVIQTSWWYSIWRISPLFGSVFLTLFFLCFFTVPGVPSGGACVCECNKESARGLFEGLVPRLPYVQDKWKIRMKLELAGSLVLRPENQSTNLASIETRQSDLLVVLCSYSVSGCTELVIILETLAITLLCLKLGVCKYYHAVSAPKILWNSQGTSRLHQIRSQQPSCPWLCSYRYHVDVGGLYYVIVIGCWLSRLLRPPSS